MNRFTSIFLILLLFSFLAFSFFSIKTVEAVTIKPDGSVDPPTLLIQRNGDLYTLTGNLTESIEVQRSNITIDGNGYTLQGSGSESGISIDGFLNDAKNVTLRNLRITNFYYGIDLIESSHNTIYGNIIYNTTQGIFIGASSFNNISGNSITNPVSHPNPAQTYGIQISGSSYNNEISDNEITNNDYGIYLFYVSSQNMISSNNITSSLRGVDLLSSNNTIFSENIIADSLTAGLYFRQSSCNNTVFGNTISNNNRGVHLDPYSRNNTISGNTIALNANGVYLLSSSDNSFYENNFIDNIQHVYSEFSGFTNFFNRDYPIGGNFWNNYAGVDIHSGSYQNFTGSDGLGDTHHIIDADNADHYPLMGPFSSLQPSPDYSLSIITNSTIEGFSYFNQNGTIKIRVSNTSSTQIFGFMRVTIPKSLIGPPYTVVIDAVQTPLNLNDTLYDTATQRWIYFAYQHSTREISIQGVLPDVTPPTIGILSPESRTYNARDVQLIFTVNEPTQWMGYTLDGQNNLTISGNATIMNLPDGPHTIRVYANDTAGNTGISSAVQFSVEATPPAIQILSPENKTYNARGVPLTFTLSEPASWIGYSLNGAPNSSISGNSTISNLLNGTHSVTVCANDTFGNMGRSNTVHFTIRVSSPDITPPQILITSPENKTYTTSDGTVNIQLAFVLNEPATWIAYSLDKRPNITMTGNTTLSGLSKGVHSIVVYALDTAGNTGASLTRHFSVEAQMPPPPPEPFPPVWLILAAIVTVIAAGTAILIYIRKTRKKT